MTARLLHRGRQKTFALVFDKWDEVVRDLTAFATDNRLSAAHFTGIGALSDVTLGFFEHDRRDYRRIRLSEQVELLSMLGDVALEADAPRIHAHVVVGRADGSACGGHLLEAHVWPTLELILTESPRHLRRRSDPVTGLALIDLG
jgi:predicted DNA-binding protein with PD1-like motif